MDVHGTAIARYEREKVKTIYGGGYTTGIESVFGLSCRVYDILLEKVLFLILDIQKLKENDRWHVFALLDAFLKTNEVAKHFINTKATRFRVAFAFFIHKIIISFLNNITLLLL
ncbi:MAG: hypothetical protein MUW56_17515 [Chryseobacterium sp.]|uniref:hypothetical protein n=1 Tax=Chryseobacterium sp. TaxID=1871047 RepID=UPI0025B7D1EC|nr:hypothetical protein [Chryseobacterium sp.]MCJ7935368.1 hypothetical protein [Chryseobacterium sp.]